MLSPLIWCRRTQPEVCLAVRPGDEQEVEGPLGGWLLCGLDLGQSIQVKLCGLQEGLRDRGGEGGGTVTVPKPIPALRADFF